MPPKGKKAVKKTAADLKKAPMALGDDANPKLMSKPQLEKVLTSVRQELQHELERDKLRTFWEITRRKLSDSKNELRKAESQMEKKEEDQEEIMKINKLKEKYLIYEQFQNIAEVHEEAKKSLEASENAFLEQEQVLLKDKRNLLTSKQEMIEQCQDLVCATKMQLCDNVSQERGKLKNEVMEFEKSFEDDSNQEREQCLLRFKIELSELEERKNRQIAELQKKHELAFHELKMFYNEVDHNNLALISSLKEQLAGRTLSEQRMRMTLKETQKENERLSESSAKAIKDAAEFSRLLTNYNKDKASLSAAKRKIDILLKDLDTLHWEKESLLLISQKLLIEKNDTAGAAEYKVLDMQLNCGIRTELLEQNIKVLKNLLVKRETQCAELVGLVKGLNPIPQEILRK